MDPETDHTPADNTHGASLTPDRRALLAGIGGLASTGKTLAKAETRIAINSTNTPRSAATSSIFRITQPGSHSLTRNVQGEPGKHGIEIAASRVTINRRGVPVIGAGLGPTAVVGPLLNAANPPTATSPFANIVTCYPLTPARILA